jgi:protein SSD1
MVDDKGGADRSGFHSNRQAGRRGHQSSNSFSNVKGGNGGGNNVQSRALGTSIHAPANSGGVDPSAAVNDLQNLIQDIKGNNAGSNSAEAESSLAEIGNRLAAQEEHLQNQLQQRLGRQNFNAGRLGGGGHNVTQSFSSRPTDLPSLGEDDAADSTTTGGLGSIGPSQGGAPRFAGNAAFQSAIARHAASNQQQQRSGAAAVGHQRQRSLQERFAEMGFPAATTEFSSNEDTLGDDSSALFDPTRNITQRTSVATGGGGGSGHRATMSVAGYEPYRRVDQTENRGTGGHLHANSVSGTLYAENLALQQEITRLQMQQQQLLQQQVQFTPSTAMLATQQQQQQPQAQTGRGAGHRRIQSHAPQTGPMGSFATQGTNLGVIGQQQLHTPGSGGANTLPRGHGRRHSVNVMNKNAAANQAPSADAGKPLDHAFSSPQEAAPAPYLATQHHAPVRGHFSRPSVQLSSLSPEYLMAGGGLVNFSALNLGAMNDLADGFGGGVGGAGGGRGGHARTGSQSWRINGAPGGAVQTLDLAQAQAQLSSLNQFRAQASGGVMTHGKMPSFGGGFNPAMMGGGFPGQHMTSPGQGGPQRKALFGSYLPQASLPPLLAAGKIVVGVLRVNKRNRSDAYVATEVLESDIFISGSKDRNRALDGDVVAVELLDPNEVWSIKREKEDKKKRKEEQSHSTQHLLNNRKPDKAKDDLEVEGSQLKLIEDEEDNEDAPPALAGHVVAIIERVPNKLFSGTIGLLRPSSAATKEKQQAERAAREGGDPSAYEPVNQQRPKIIWFRPSDKRCPLVAVPADQAPTEFWDNPKAYEDRLFLCSIKRWPLTSLHPFGTLVEELGVIGNRDALSTAIFKECLSIDETFSESALRCLPPLPWSIPEREISSRRDFRAHRVFSIDPPTAKDLDDAMSVVKLDGGLYEIGVHIADVAHFLKMGSALDREARKRGTSVYMVERMIPMLPPTLSEELCSLRPDVERLSYSCVFTMNKDAHVIGTWMGRTVIKSCAQLAYSDAQKVIDGEHLDASKITTHSAEDVEGDIAILHGLAQKMRARRFENGAVRIDNVKLAFKLDEDRLPTDAVVYAQKESHRLIEEFMLLANMTVAQHIAAGLPDLALLRRHEKPMERRLAGFERRAKQMGVEIDTSSGGAIYKSLQAIEDETTRKTLEALITKSMLRAKYFCTGMVDIAKYAHFALNAPLYTHFTSPIRRYADVMVHRQLEAVLTNAEKFPMDAEGIAKIAQQCNVKRDAAKLAQEQSDHLFLCLLIHDLTVRYGPVIRQATVMGVLDAAFDVIVHEFGIEKRVHVDQIPVEHHSYDERDGVLSLWWTHGRDTIEWLSENSEDSHLKAIRGHAQHHAQKSEMRMASQTVDAEAALFDDEEDETLAEVQRKVWSGEDAAGSEQRTKSFEHADIRCEGAKRTSTGHYVQEIKEIRKLPVVITADMSKAPPVIKVFAVNPWGHGGEASD